MSSRLAAQLGGLRSGVLQLSASTAPNETIVQDLLCTTTTYVLSSKKVSRVWVVLKQHLLDGVSLEKLFLRLEAKLRSLVLLPCEYLLYSWRDLIK